MERRRSRGVLARAVAGVTALSVVGLPAAAVAAAGTGSEAGPGPAERVTGIVTPYVVEDPDPDSGATVVRVIDTGDDLVPLTGTDLETRVPSHAEVTVEVRDTGDGPEVTRVLGSEPPPATTDRERRRAAAAQPVHEVSVAFVRPRGTTAADPMATPQQVSAAMTRVGDYWRSQTGGRVSFTLAATLPAYSSAHGCAGDDVWRLWEEADRRLGGVRGKPASHLMLVLPRKAYTDLGCAYGLGSVGTGPASGGDLYVVSDDPSLIAHELGHNLGLNHSGSLVCTDRQDATVDDADGCTIAEYDDHLDVMSSSGPTRGAGALNAAHVDDLGLLPSSLVTVGGEAERTVEVAPLASMAGVRGVKVVVDPATTYFVQYRTRVGRDAAAPASYELGVEVHRGENPWAAALFAPTSSLFLDATPGEEEQGVVRALPVGGTFTSADGRVEVEVLAQDRGSATVAVRTRSAPVRDPARRPAAVAIDTPATVGAQSWFRPAATVTDQEGRPVRGVDVRLQRRWPGATVWNGVATATTGTDGRAVLRTRTSRTAVYRWVAMRTDAWPAVASQPRTVSVR